MLFFTTTTTSPYSVILELTGNSRLFNAYFRVQMEGGGLFHVVLSVARCHMSVHSFSTNIPALGGHWAVAWLLVEQYLKSSLLPITAPRL